MEVVRFCLLVFCRSLFESICLTPAQGFLHRAGGKMGTFLMSGEGRMSCCSGAALARSRKRAGGDRIGMSGKWLVSLVREPTERRLKTMASVGYKHGCSPLASAACICSEGQVAATLLEVAWLGLT